MKDGCCLHSSYKLLRHNHKGKTIFATLKFYINHLLSIAPLCNIENHSLKHVPFQTPILKQHVRAVQQLPVGVENLRCSALFQNVVTFSSDLVVAITTRLNTAK